MLDMLRALSGREWAAIAGMVFVGVTVSDRQYLFEHVGVPFVPAVLLALLLVAASGAGLITIVFEASGEHVPARRRLVARFAIWSSIVVAVPAWAVWQLTTGGVRDLAIDALIIGAFMLPLLAAAVVSYRRDRRGDRPRREWSR